MVHAWGKMTTVNISVKLHYYIHSLASYKLGTRSFFTRIDSTRLDQVGKSSNLRKNTW